MWFVSGDFVPLAVAEDNVAELTLRARRALIGSGFQS